MRLIGTVQVGISTRAERVAAALADPLALLVRAAHPVVWLVQGFRHEDRPSLRHAPNLSPARRSH